MMGISEAEPVARGSRGAPRRESLEEQVRRLGLQPVASAEDMARDDIFDSDEELDAFLAHVHAERHANLA
jgi:toxin FitB